MYAGMDPPTSDDGNSTDSSRSKAPDYVSDSDPGTIDGDVDNEKDDRSTIKTARFSDIIETTRDNASPLDLSAKCKTWLDNGTPTHDDVIPLDLSQNQLNESGWEMRQKSKSSVMMDESMEKKSSTSESEKTDRTVRERSSFVIVNESENDMEISEPATAAAAADGGEEIHEIDQPAAPIPTAQNNSPLVESNRAEDEPMNTISPEQNGDQPPAGGNPPPGGAPSGNNPPQRPNSPPKPDQEPKYPNLEKLFPPLETRAQRDRYLRTFDTDHAIYLRLYHKMRPHAVELRSLQEQLRTLPAQDLSDDQHRRELQAQIQSKIDALGFGESKSYQRVREQYEYYVAKIRFIKRRIAEFKEKLLAKGGGGGEKKKEKRARKASGGSGRKKSASGGGPKVTNVHL